MPPNTAVCRMCLDVDVRMVKLSGTPLQSVYEKIADTALHSSGRPLTACYMCHAQLAKCYKLMLKTAAAEIVLQDLLTRCLKVTVKTVSGVDRYATGLSGSLTISRPEVIDSPPTTSGVQSAVQHQGTPETDTEVDDDDDEESDSDDDDTVIVPQQDSVTNINIESPEAPDASNLSEESSDEDIPLSSLTSPPDGRGDREHLGRVTAPACDTSEHVIISSDDEEIDEDKSQIPTSSTSQPQATTNKPDFCFFCETRVFNFGEHVLRKHTAEPEVQSILSYPEKSSFRKYLFNDLLKKGNYITNVSYVKPTETEEFQCEKCLAKYSKKQFLRHKESCQISHTAQNDTTAQIYKQISITAQVDTQPMVVNAQKQQISSAQFETQSIPLKEPVSETGETLLKKKRGRRRKHHQPESTQIETLIPQVSQSAQKTLKRRGRPPKHHKSIIMETQKQQISTTSNIETQRISFLPQFDPKNLISKISQIETQRTPIHQLDPKNQISKTAQIKTTVMQKPSLTTTQRFISNNILKSRKFNRFWTTEQKELVLNVFSEQIKNRMLPTEEKCAALHTLHGDVLHNKGPEKIRAFIRNALYRNRTGDIFLKLGVNRFEPQNQISKTARIKTLAVPKSTQKYISNKNIKNKKKKKPIRWTPEQKELVLNFFSEHIKSKKLPNVNECASLHILHADVLHNKDWMKIRAFVRHALYGYRRGDSFLNAGVSRFESQNQISKTAKIKTLAVPKSTKKFVSNKILKNGKKSKLVRWTPEQKELVLNSFSEHIKSKKSPNVKECTSLHILHPDVLHNKDPMQIRIFVRNALYRNGTGDSFFNAGVSRFEPQNQVSRTARIKTLAMPKSTKKFVSNKILKNGKKRRRWTPEQKELVLNFFKQHIKNRKLPNEDECASLHTLHADVLHNKDPMKIRAFVRNALYGNRTGDSFLNAGVSRFEPQNQISKTAKIKTLAVPKSTKKFVTNKILKNGKKRILVRWTPEQKELVLNFFSEHVKNRKLPTEEECASLHTLHADTLHNKDPMKIKFFVQNVRNRNLREDLFSNVGVSETPND